MKFNQKTQTGCDGRSRAAGAEVEEREEERREELLKEQQRQKQDVKGKD